jgi:hypothetical protein
MLLQTLTSAAVLILNPHGMQPAVSLACGAERQTFANTYVMIVGEGLSAKAMFD